MTEQKLQDIDKAMAFVETLTPQADRYVKSGGDTYPMFLGWAVRRAFLAGLDEGRKERGVLPV